MNIIEIRAINSTLTAPLSLNDVEEIFGNSIEARNALQAGNNSEVAAHLDNINDILSKTNASFYPITENATSLVINEDKGGGN